jgi:ABC-type antimicrobial peptide transport system permease subunit
VTKLMYNVVPLAWAVRTTGDPSGLRTAIEREFHAVDAMISVADERSMEQVVAESVARQNFNMVLLTLFAAIALLLAAIGVYGLMAYSVEQRTQEIGIRMALGAARIDMLKLVLAQGMKLVGAGVAIGAGLAYGATRVMQSLLFGVKASDPVTFAAVAGILTLVAAIATLIPARRASSVQPLEALHHQ